MNRQPIHDRFSEQVGPMSASMRRIEKLLEKNMQKISPSPLSKTGLTAERVRQLTKNMR